MKKLTLTSGKTVGIIAGIVVTITVIGTLVYVFKKTKKEEEEEEVKKEEEKIQVLDDLGVSRDTLDKVMNKGEFVTRLQYLIRHSTKWSDELLDEDKYIENPEIPVIHISQSADEYPGQYPGQVDIYLEVPEINFRYPKIGEYKTAIIKALPKGKDHYPIALELFVVINKKEEGKYEQRFIRVLPESYKSYKDDGTDGTLNFYYHSLKDRSDLMEILTKRFGKEVSIVKMVLMWRVSFPLKEDTIQKVPLFLNEIVKMGVGEKDNIVTYNMLLFHAVDLNYETVYRNELSVDLISLKGEVFTLQY